MAAAVIVLLLRLPPGLGLNGAAHVAGALGQLRAGGFSLDPSRRYTVWTGVFGGLFLSLSYFGTDQSQVQRYIAGPSLRNSRLGLMFNAVLKIPMQFVILMLGAFLFVFYQFVPSPVVFNQAAGRGRAQGGRVRGPRGRRASRPPAAGSRPAPRRTSSGRRARAPPWSRPAIVRMPSARRPSRLSSPATPAPSEPKSV